MRFLLTILCFITLQASGQALFHAHNKATTAPCTDADACAFLTATQITDATTKSAVLQLVASLKSSGLWSKMLAVYPMASDGTMSRSEQVRYNLKDTALHKLTISSGSFGGIDAGGPTFSASQYFKTGIVPSSHLTLNNTHMSFYSLTSTAGGGDMGSSAFSFGDNLNMQMLIRYDNGELYFDQYSSTARVTGTNADGTGYYISSRPSSSEFFAYKNGAQFSSTYSGTSGGLPTTELYIGSVNNTTNDGIPSFSGGRKCAFATIGDGLSTAEAASLNTIVETFNDALSRGVQ